MSPTYGEIRCSALGCTKARSPSTPSVTPTPLALQMDA